MNQPTAVEVKYSGRLQVVYLAMLVGVAVVGLRLAHLQLIMHRYYQSLADNTHFVQRVVPAERGDILTWDEQLGNYYPLATNVTLYALNAVPHQIENVDLTVEKLRPFLNPETNWDKLRSDLASGKLYLPPLKRKISEGDAKTIGNLELDGIYLTPEKYRYYPEGSMLANALGFVNLDRLGQYGVEGYLDNELKGHDGSLETEKDAAGKPIALGKRQSVTPTDGLDVVLTIDRAIQYFAENELKATVDRYSAAEGSVIIMNAKTGAIMAMAQYPTFDPNDYTKSSLELFSNLNTQKKYEPGSVFKALTMAMGIDLGVISPSTTYVDTGELTLADHTIKNSDGAAHGVQTMSEVLEKSLNTGAAFVAQKVGKRQFMKYLEKFGFTKKTGIELAGETFSVLRDVRQVQEIDLASMSFGQGIAVTPIALLQAISALANDGKMVQPHIISQITYPSGPVDVKPHTEQVISPQTANLVAAMMINVVEKGHGKKAGVAGYRIAGKTGTAQIPGPGGYLPANQTIGTFVGFGPVEDPQFVMLTRIDRPAGVQFAESTAAPMFGEIANFMMQYLQIPPTR